MAQKNYYKTRVTCSHVQHEPTQNVSSELMQRQITPSIKIFCQVYGAENNKIHKFVYFSMWIMEDKALRSHQK